MAKTTSGRNRKDQVKISAYFSRGEGFVIKESWCKKIGITPSKFAREAILHFIDTLEKGVASRKEEQDERLQQEEDATSIEQD